MNDIITDIFNATRTLYPEARIPETPMPKWTPGPWECGLNPRWTPDAEWAISRQLVVRPVGEFPHGRWVADCGLAVDDEYHANARLIAAAPELYDALVQLVEWHHGPSPNPVTTANKYAARDKALAALRKARGEP